MQAKIEPFEDCRDCWFCRIEWNEAICLHPRNPYNFQELTVLPTARSILRFKNRQSLPPLIPPPWCVLRNPIV